MDVRVGDLVMWSSAAGTICGEVTGIGSILCADRRVRRNFHIRNELNGREIRLIESSLPGLRFRVLVRDFKSSLEHAERTCREYDEARELYFQ